MQKTYSQKVARVFEIICYLLLVPTVLSLIYPVFFIIGGITEASYAMVFYGLIPFIIVIPGLILLIGYAKHSRDRLDEKFVSALWLTTAVYNFLLLLPWFFVVAEKRLSQGNFLITACIVFGYIAAIVFSLKAYSFEKRKKLI